MKVITIIALVFTLFMTSCSKSKVNMDNFDKISNGMDKEQCIKILGEPTELREGIVDDVRIWTDGERQIVLRFDRHAVVYKKKEKGL